MPPATRLNYLIKLAQTWHHTRQHRTGLTEELCMELASEALRSKPSGLCWDPSFRGWLDWESADIAESACPMSGPSAGGPWPVPEAAGPVAPAGLAGKGWAGCSCMLLLHLPPPRHF